MKKFFALRYVISLTAAFLASEACAQLEGTLFTQPEEREYLDYLREEFLRNNQEAGFDIAEVVPVVPQAEVVVETGPQEFTYGGIMTRRDGGRSVWLNGRLLEEDDLPAGLRLVDTTPGASLRIAQGDSIFLLRPGQMVTLSTGAIIENYQRPPIAVAVEASSSTQPSSDTEVLDTNIEMTASAEADSTAAVISESQDSVDAVANALMQLDDEQIASLVETIQKGRAQAEETPVAEDINDASE